MASRPAPISAPFRRRACAAAAARPPPGCAQSRPPSPTHDEYTASSSRCGEHRRSTSKLSPGYTVLHSASPLASSEDDEMLLLLPPGCSAAAHAAGAAVWRRAARRSAQSRSSSAKETHATASCAGDVENDASSRKSMPVTPSMAQRECITCVWLACALVMQPYLHTAEARMRGVACVASQKTRSTQLTSSSRKRSSLRVSGSRRVCPSRSGSKPQSAGSAGRACTDARATEVGEGKTTRRGGGDRHQHTQQ